MIEENPVKEFDTSLFGEYRIREAAEVYAVQLTDNVQAALKVDDVERAEYGHHKTYYKNGTAKEYEEIKYYVRNKGVAYPGDWLIWNGTYLAIMPNKDFIAKYMNKRTSI